MRKKELSKLAVVDCLHNDVGRNETGFITVANQHTLIAVFINHSRCAISSIKDCLNSSIFKDSLITACTYKLFGDVIMAFLFGKTFQVIIHDNTLP